MGNQRRLSRLRGTKEEIRVRERQKEEEERVKEDDDLGGTKKDK